MKEDAMVYAEAIFLTKMTRKNLLTQMRQVDNGDNSARMHEVVNQTVGQIRENAKFLSGQKSELEKFYKTLRKDLGYSEIEQEALPIESETKSPEGEVTTNRELNEMIKQAMLNKAQDKAK